MKHLLLVLFFALFVFTLSGCAGVKPPTQSELATADFGKYPYNYEFIVKSYLANVLFDPYSAALALDEKAVMKAWRKVGNEYKYGYAIGYRVNAKNRYGAYTGAEIGVIIVKNGSIIETGNKALVYWKTTNDIESQSIKESHSKKSETNNNSFEKLPGRATDDTNSVVSKYESGTKHKALATGTNKQGKKVMAAAWGARSAYLARVNALESCGKKGGLRCNTISVNGVAVSSQAEIDRIK